MPFNGKSGKFNSSINTVEFDCGDKAVKIGGENDRKRNEDRRYDL